jgi:hypothetical protein
MASLALSLPTHSATSAGSTFLSANGPFDAPATQFSCGWEFPVRALVGGIVAVAAYRVPPLHCPNLLRSTRG